MTSHPSHWPHPSDSQRPNIVSPIPFTLASLSKCVLSSALVVSVKLASSFRTVASYLSSQSRSVSPAAGRDRAGKGRVGEVGELQDETRRLLQGGTDMARGGQGKVRHRTREGPDACNGLQNDVDLYPYRQRTPVPTSLVGPCCLHLPLPLTHASGCNPFFLSYRLHSTHLDG